MLRLRNTLNACAFVCVRCYKQYKRPSTLYISNPHPPLVEREKEMGEGNTERGRTSQGELNFINKNLVKGDMAEDFEDCEGKNNFIKGR